ncbi:SpoIIE family protein phosphatase [Streptomyces sp. NPDC014006]|uniref:SpoIIE family protein phosphatase n=1 Tax=Streptomyces sp. NPDC014006 TaxID=3364870 RepID=UPI0036FA9DC6
MTSEPVLPAESGNVPDLAALSRVVAHQRAEMDRLHDMAAASAVLERAKGAVMAMTGCSPETAYEELMHRAKAAERTLLEECWITLGTLAAPPPRPSQTRRPGAGSDLAEPLEEPPALRDDATALARLGRTLLRVHSPQGLAAVLLRQLRRRVDATAIMIYQRPHAGGLELIGQAGLDELTASQWHHVPPLPGVAARDSLEAQQEQWLEDIEAVGHTHLLIGDPPERWPSRAWLPVSVGGRANVVLGVLCGRTGPFTDSDRTHLRAVARLCAGRLRSLDAPREPAVDAAADVVQGVFETLPGAALLLTPLRSASGEVEDFRIDAATPQAVDAVGRTGRELVGLRLLEYRPSVADEPLWQGCLRVLATGEPYEGEPLAQRVVAGGVTELVTSAPRVARLGAGLVVNWVRHDPSDRQEQRLADVQRLGNLGWANWNLVTHEATWSAQTFTVLGRDPARGPVRLAELPSLAVPEDMPALAGAVGQLLRDGQRFDVPFRVRTPDGIRHLRVVAEAVADSSGAPVEVHGFVQDLSARRNAELALVESERAMLTQHGVLQAERALATRLQHALLPLPRTPVDLAGLRVEIAYLPAQSGLSVGGDWFSAVRLPDGDALFVVGDVAGHGIDAVATMAQLRFTAKGMISTGSSLTGALARLNRLLLHSRDPHGTATLILARYRAEGRRLVWAQAGHPPPMLLRDGRARPLERPAGMLLGATDAPYYEEAECRLRPGDRLVLYTDGLVERPGECIDLGFDRLAAALGSPAPDPSGTLAPLLAALLEGERRDDVCVVDIRVPEDSD